MVLAILQARTSSTRLPGKVLKPIEGKPMLLLQIERCMRARTVDKLIIATSIDPSDDPIEELCRDHDIACFRGSLSDVLDRYYHAAKLSMPEHVVRLTGDCPLADPHVIDAVVSFHMKGGYDYSSNTLEPTYPDGLDVEVFRFACLAQAWREATLPSQREHVTPFFRRHPERFNIGSVKSEIDLSQYRWTVDRPLDFELVARIYEALYRRNPTFTTRDILDFLNDHPALKTMNARYERNEGYRKSLEEDSLLKKEREEHDV